MKPRSNKMVVICLDGGTFDIIQPMVERKELPHLSALMSEGVHHRLLSTIPFVWRKREVKGAQLRNTIVNLRN